MRAERLCRPVNQSLDPSLPGILNRQIQYSGIGIFQSLSGLLEKLLVKPNNWKQGKLVQILS